MSSKSPEKIEGKDWGKEVINRSYKREKIRTEFYTKLAQLKLRTDPDQVLDDPAKSGLKTFDELKTADKFSRNLNPHAVDYKEAYRKGPQGWTLSECLHSYFRKNVGITDSKSAKREVALTLHYLTQQKDTSGRAINVDYLNAKWKIEIVGGQIFIYDKNGNRVIDGAYLRKPGGTPPPGPVPPPVVPPPGPVLPPVVPPPGPVKPEDLDRKPFNPEEIEDELIRANNPKYDVHKKAYFKSGHLFKHKKEMTSETITQRDADGNPVMLDVLFITNKGDVNNPPYYVTVNRNDPYELGIGKMRYDHGMFVSDARFGPIDRSVSLTRGSRATTKQSITDLLKTL